MDHPVFPPLTKESLLTPPRSGKSRRWRKGDIVEFAGKRYRVTRVKRPAPGFENVDLEET